MDGMRWGICSLRRHRVSRHSDFWTRYIRGTEPASLDVIERFFLDRGAPVLYEVSPFAGVAALVMLCTRNYRPIEISNVLCRPVERPTTEEQSAASVRVVAPEEAQLWSDISARGWSHEHPELRDFLLDLGAISAARQESLCFLAEHDGKPGA